ncbi:MAG: type II toxin-antitoxin system RelE/ParE family toxin [Rhodospirillaceae bacterium]|nr:type II toxin-antitoxin system RelE/ParE family toxin [Rhodospirillaceae bacterium]
MRIVWLRKALYDIDAIEEYAEQNNPADARAVEQKIKKTVSLLDCQPEIGRHGRVPDTRELVVPGTPYIVAYTIAKSEVVILAVIHGARKWPDRL